MSEATEGRSRTTAFFAGVGVSFAGFIVIAILSTIKPTQWLVPVALLGGAYFYRHKATNGLWGFDTKRTSNIGWWTGGLAAFFALAGSATPPPKSAADTASETASVAKADPAKVKEEKLKEEAEAKRERMREEPEQFVELQNINWSKDFSIMELSVTIKNNSEYTLKDFVIDCEHSGPSGTVMDSNRREIFEIVEAGKSKRIRNFNMGFINSQSTSTACIIKRAKLVEN
jgi:hypothetical protein